MTLPKPTILSEDEMRLAESSSKMLQDIIRFHDDGKEDESFQMATLRVSVERGNGEKADVARLVRIGPSALTIR